MPVFIFRRERRAGDEPVMRGFLDERVEEELRGTFHGRIDFCQIFFVDGEEIMFPQILAEPRAAHRPHAGVRPVNRCGRAPQIRVVMDDPAVCVVVDFGRAGAGVRQIHDHRRQRLDAFGKIGHFGGPVIHLRVDVDGVLAAPRRIQSFQIPCRFAGWVPGRELQMSR